MQFIDDTEAYLAQQKRDQRTRGEGLWSPQGQIGRRSYLVSTIVITVLGLAVAFLLTLSQPYTDTKLVLGALLGFSLKWIFICLAFKRVRHIGAPSWVALLSIPPLINLILWIYLIATPGKADREAQTQKKNLAAERERAIYTQIGDELESGSIDKGLWTKLFAEVGGDEARVRARYIDARARTLRQSKSTAAQLGSDECSFERPHGASSIRG